MKTTLPAPLISLGALAIATALGTGGCDEEPEQKDWTESLPPETSGPPEFCADKDIATATNDTGDPIGGGTGYSRGPASCDVEVDTAATLVDALEGAVAGQIVCVADGAEIDLTGQRDIPLYSGVTLAGHRGQAGSEGGQGCHQGPRAREAVGAAPTPRQWAGKQWWRRNGKKRGAAAGSGGGGARRRLRFSAVEQAPPDERIA